MTAPSPRLGVAAVGPVMLKVAAEESDDVKLHSFCTRKYLSRASCPRRRGPGRRRAARARAFEISGGGFVVTGKDDEAVAKLFDWVRYRVAFYGSTQAYWPVFEVHGLGDLGRKLNAMTRAGQWNQMAREVSDDVVHLFSAVGRHDQIAKAIGRASAAWSIRSAPAPIPRSRPTCRPICCRTSRRSRRSTGPNTPDLSVAVTRGQR